MTDTAVTWGGWDADIRDDPDAHFAAARSQCPVQHVRLPDGSGAWVVLSHAAARQALNDPRISKDMLAAMADDPTVVSEGLPGPGFARHMLAVDPPDHTRLRRLVARAFVPSRVAALEPTIQTIADELLDGLQATGPHAVVDLVEGFALPLPYRVICELLGIPDADRPLLHDSFRTLLRPWTGDPPPEAVAASDTIVECLHRLVESKRRSPTDDLVSVIVSASNDGEQLTQQEVLSTIFQLFVAGHDTTTSLIGNGIVALLDHPDELDRLQQNVELLPTAVDELMRFTAPVPHATFRVTAEPLALDGVEIPAGEQVLVSLAAANRDPAHFTEPDRLDLGRAGSNLGFGHGIHFCLGAPLARLEARIAFSSLFQRFPGLRLGCDRRDLAWSHGDGLVLRGLTELPIILGPAS